MPKHLRSGAGLILILAALPLAACQPQSASNPHAAEACVQPGDAMVARALMDQAVAALAHADAKTAVDALEAGLARIGYPSRAGPPVLDNTGLGIEAARGAGDAGRLAKVEQRVLASRLADYQQYCGH